MEWPKHDTIIDPEEIKDHGMFGESYDDYGLNDDQSTILVTIQLFFVDYLQKMSKTRKIDPRTNKF